MRFLCINCNNNAIAYAKQSEVKTGGKNTRQGLWDGNCFCRHDDPFDSIVLVVEQSIDAHRSPVTANIFQGAIVVEEIVVAPEFKDAGKIYCRARNK